MLSPILLSTVSVKCIEDVSDTLYKYIIIIIIIIIMTPVGNQGWCQSNDDTSRQLKLVSK